MNSADASTVKHFSQSVVQSSRNASKTGAPMRKSNIELLRVLAMLLIVLHHFSVHGPWPEPGPLSSDVAVWLLSFGGKLGVDVFVLITGYFSSRSRFKSRSVLKVACATWFYSSALLLAFWAAGSDLVTPRWAAKTLLPLSSGEYWFVTGYVALMLLSPFLNALYARLSQDGRRRLIVVGFVVLSLVPTLTTFNTLSSTLVWFIYLYVLGAWLRDVLEASAPGGLNLLDPASVARRFGGAAPAAGIAAVWASIALIGWAQREYGFDLVEPKYLAGQNMVPTLMAAAGLLAQFARLDVPPSRTVNAIAQTTFGVYLIHDNPLVRNWLWPHFAFLYQYGWVAILTGGAAATITVFAACSLIDFARIRLVERPFFRLLERACGSGLDRMDAWFNSIVEDGRG